MLLILSNNVTSENGSWFKVTIASTYEPISRSILYDDDCYNVVSRMRK